MEWFHPGARLLGPRRRLLNPAPRRARPDPPGVCGGALCQGRDQRTSRRLLAPSRPTGLRPGGLSRGGRAPAARLGRAAAGGRCGGAHPPRVYAPGLARAGVGGGAEFAGPRGRAGVWAGPRTGPAPAGGPDAGPPPVCRPAVLCGPGRVPDRPGVGRPPAHRRRWYVESNKVPPQFTNPPGYQSPAASVGVLRGTSGLFKLFQHPSLERFMATGLVFAGNPDSVYQQIRHFSASVGGFGHMLLLMGQARY